MLGYFWISWNGSRFPEFTISKETSFVTTPLNEDGTINYLAALNEKLGKDVTPENNAAVILIEVLGPSPIESNLQKEYFRKLGIPPPPENGRYFLGLTEYARDKSLDVDALYRNFKIALSRPWKQNEFPDLFDWLKLNESSFKKVEKTLRLDSSFSPLISLNADPDAPRNCQLFRSCAAIKGALCARATLRIQERDFKGAENDIVLCHRLSKLIDQSPYLIDAILALFCESDALTASQVFAASRDLSSSQLLSHMRSLERLSSISSIADRFDFSDRCICLDRLQNGLIYLSGKNIEGLAPSAKTSQRFFDWNAIFREVNLGFNELEKIALEPKFSAFAERLDALQSELFKKSASFKNIDSPFYPNQIADCGIPPQAIAAAVLDERIFKYAKHVMQINWRLRQKKAVTVLALTIAAYRSDNGDYPLSLQELKPKYLPTIPADMFTNEEPLRYHKTTNGFSLYSVGPNGIDNEGKGDDSGESTGDDIAVIVSKTSEFY